MQQSDPFAATGEMPAAESARTRRQEALPFEEASRPSSSHRNACLSRSCTLKPLASAMDDAPPVCDVIAVGDRFKVNSNASPLTANLSPAAAGCLRPRCPPALPRPPLVSFVVLVAVRVDGEVHEVAPLRTEDEAAVVCDAVERESWLPSRSRSVPSPHTNRSACRLVQFTTRCMPGCPSRQLSSASGTAGLT